MQPVRHNTTDPTHGIEEPNHAGFGGDLEGVSHHDAGRVRERLLERLGENGQGGHRGRGPRNHSRSDERIREAVCDGFMDDSWLDASDIEVGVNLGEVRLSGWVGSRIDKRRAEVLAEAMAGVTHVQNDLRVRPSDQPQDAQSDGGRRATTDQGR